MKIFKFLLSLVLVSTVSEINADMKKERSLNSKQWGYLLVNDPILKDNDVKVERFEVRSGDCGRDSTWDDCETDRERSEISVKKNLSTNGNYWIGFSIFLPNDFKSSSRVRTTLGQIHMKGGFSGVAGGFKSFPPLLQLNAYGDSFITQYHRLSGSKTKIIDKGDYRGLLSLAEMRGKWTHVMINLNSQGKSSIVEIFIDGQLKERFEQKLPGVPKYYYLKYGIYRSFVSRHGEAMPNQVVMFKDIKISKNRSDVDPYYASISAREPQESEIRNLLIEHEKKVKSLENFQTIEGKKSEACKDENFIKLMGKICG